MSITVTSPGDQAAVVNESATISLGSFVDSRYASFSEGAQWQTVIMFDDGHSETIETLGGPGSVSLGALSHTFNAASTFLATVTVTNPDNDIGQATFSISVTGEGGGDGGGGAGSTFGITFYDYETNSHVGTNAVVRTHLFEYSPQRPEGQVLQTITTNGSGVATGINFEDDSITRYNRAQGIQNLTVGLQRQHLSVVYDGVTYRFSIIPQTAMVFALKADGTVHVPTRVTVPSGAKICYGLESRTALPFLGCDKVTETVTSENNLAIIFPEQGSRVVIFTTDGGVSSPARTTAIGGTSPPEIQVHQKPYPLVGTADINAALIVNVTFQDLDMACPSIRSSILWLTDDEDENTTLSGPISTTTEGWGVLYCKKNTAYRLHVRNYYGQPIHGSRSDSFLLTTGANTITRFTATMRQGLAGSLRTDGVQVVIMPRYTYSGDRNSPIGTHIPFVRGWLTTDSNGTTISSRLAMSCGLGRDASLGPNDIKIGDIGFKCVQETTQYFWGHGPHVVPRVGVELALTGIGLDTHAYFTHYPHNQDTGQDSHRGENGSQPFLIDVAQNDNEIWYATIGNQVVAGPMNPIGGMYIPILTGDPELREQLRWHIVRPSASAVRPERGRQIETGTKFRNMFL